MVRSFPSDFAGHLTDRNSKPYFVLEIQWGTTASPDTVYYVDRPTSEFSASGTRHPTITHKCYVIDWGSLSLTLRESQVGSVDRTMVKLHDDGSIIARLNSNIRQKKTIKIYRMWDENNVTWSGDAALLFVGTIKPYSWQVSDNTISIEFEDSARSLSKTLELIARKEVFESTPDEYRDKNIPLCWGRAHRVEAILVQRPWETRILEQIPRGVSEPAIYLEHRLSELGIPDVSDAQVWIGFDLYNVRFIATGGGDESPDYMIILSAAKNHKAIGVISQAYETGTDRYGVIQGQSITPVIYRESLASVWEAGDTMSVLNKSTGMWVSTTITTLTADTPWQGSYKIQFATSGLLQPGVPVRFATPGDPEIRAWEAGTVVRAKDGDWIYAINALPAQDVIKVEGYGDVEDDLGRHSKDFVIVGEYKSDVDDASDVVTNNPTLGYEVTLDDNTWDYTGEPEEGTAVDLGRWISTIKFRMAPRAIYPQLDDNRLWVTLHGVDDSGTGAGLLIQNPITVLLEYLENEHLLDLDSSQIDTASFTAAALALSDYHVGFAQTEPQDALVLLQDIARQCHCVLFFDGGKAYVKVLANSATNVAMSFSQENILEKSLKWQEAEIDDVATRLIAHWRSSWDDKTGARDKKVLGINVNAELQLRKNEREFNSWLYRERTHVESEVSFWLTRWSRVYREVSFTAFHEALKLQPADWIAVNYIVDLTDFGSDLSCDVDSVLGPKPATYVNDLTINSSGVVSAASYTFGQIDHGRAIIVDGPGSANINWISGTYVITDSPGGAAYLGIDPSTTIPNTGGKWSFENAARSNPPFIWSPTHDFTGEAGKYIQITNQDTGLIASWLPGVYRLAVIGERTIIGVPYNGAWLLEKPIRDVTESEVLHGATDGGEWLMGNTVVFDGRRCEVLEVRDTGVKGLVEVKARFAKFVF